MLRISAARWVGVGLALALSTSVSFAQTVLYVDADVPVGNGSGWCSAFKHLQDALAAASASNGAVTEIRVAQGVYRPDRGLNQTLGDRGATFRLVRNASLLGGYAGCGAANPNARDVALYESVLSGDLLGNDGADFANYAENSYHIVTYDDPAADGVSLDGFTISGGNADGANPLNQGGAVHIRGPAKCILGGPMIRNCTIRDNRASHHGAINDHGLGTVIENCTFRDNFAGEEGAGLLINSGPTQVTNCRFIDNVVDGEGGGAWASHDDDASCASAASTPVFTGCTFTGNRAISGDGSFRGKGGGFFTELNGPTLTNCVFENNEAASRGGGVDADRTAALIQDCVFRGNASPGRPGVAGSGNGGGVWMQRDAPLLGGAPRVLGSSFSDNFAGSYGGGLSLQDNAARVERCTFSRNRADSRGGGIRIDGGQTRVVACTFDDNTAVYFAGGLGIESGSDAQLLLWNSTFRRNRAGVGGALRIASSEATVGNCLFVANGPSYGGAFAVKQGSVATFVNSTFSANSAPNPPDGAVGHFSSFNNLVPSEVSLHNCILWNGVQPFRNRDSTEITITHSDVQGGWPGTNNGAVDPFFGDADGPDDILGTADDNFQLCSGSIADGRGSNAALPADVADVDGDGDTTEIVPLDLAGNARIDSGSVDMGAYEGATQACSLPFCLYGDVDASGTINFVDIASIVQVFKGLLAPITFAEADVFPCGGNSLVNFQDISADVAAFKGTPVCANTCNVTGPPQAP